MSRESIKHTPGPWAVDPAVRQGFTVYAPKEGFIVGTQDEEGRYGAIESPANARLIAAAPDMLEALQRAREVLLWNLGDDARIDAAFDAVTAAINKATYTQRTTA